MDAVWTAGANSAADPRLPEGYFVRATNVVVRSGIPRTRPGSRFLFNLPSTNVQALVPYDPTSGPPSLVLVADGYVYVSEYPFRRLRRLRNIRMSSSAKTVWVQETIQYVQRNTDGSLTLITPKKVLVFQDGVGAPGYYDGYASGMLSGVDTIPQGTAMAWSGNRLWVARRNRLFASDFGNPFSFVEQYYLGGADSLLMPGNVTALSEVPGTGNSAVLLAFQQDQTVAIQSSIPRDSWPTTANFQQTIFPDVGCVSQRSVVAQFGRLWWFSRSGLVSIDIAQQTQVSSTFFTWDNEMQHYKVSLTPSRDKVATATFDNLLLVSVPAASGRNKQTWVLDSSVMQTIGGNARPAWAGVWTGFEPIAWAKLTVMGVERLYTATVDDNGNSQLLEFFSGHRTDSGQDIECSVELRAHTGGTPTLKQFSFADVTFSDVEGTVDFRVDWRGFSRGPWKQCMSFRALVGRGSFRSDTPINSDFRVLTYQGQMRRVQTEQTTYTNEVALSSGGIESRLPESKDWAFSFLVRWNGRAALREFTPVFQPAVERTAGNCAADDKEETFTRYDGACSNAAEALWAEDNRVPVYTGSATFEGSWVDGTEVSAVAEAESLLSERTAEKMALQAAKAQVAYTLEELAEPVISEAAP
jgi:hypothetical protein